MGGSNVERPAGASIHRDLEKIRVLFSCHCRRNRVQSAAHHPVIEGKMNCVQCHIRMG